MGAYNIDTYANNYWCMVIVLLNYCNSLIPAKLISRNHKGYLCIMNTLILSGWCFLSQLTVGDNIIDFQAVNGTIANDTLK